VSTGLFLQRIAQMDKTLLTASEHVCQPHLRGGILAEKNCNLQTCLDHPFMKIDVRKAF
jgi:hypothetical protein